MIPYSLPVSERFMHINPKYRGGIPEEYKPNPEWGLKDIRYETEKKLFKCCPEAPYDRVSLNLSCFFIEFFVVQ